LEFMICFEMFSMELLWSYDLDSKFNKLAHVDPI